MFGAKGVFMSTGLAAARCPEEDQGQGCYRVWERRAQLPSLSGRMKKSPHGAIQSGPPQGLGETQCCACGRAEGGTSRVRVQGSVQLHWAEPGQGVKVSPNGAKVSWDGHAGGTWQEVCPGRKTGQGRSCLPETASSLLSSTLGRGFGSRRVWGEELSLS